MSYRIGIIGAGFLTTFALTRRLKQAPDMRLAAVLDNRPEALSAIPLVCPDAVVTRDEDEFFAVPMDAVHIATPNDLHEYFACQALRRGFPTLVDKPLAHTVASAERIAAAAAGPGRSGAASGGVAMVGYMAKHNAYNRRARELVAAGEIGTPLSMTAARLGWRKEDDWRRSPSRSGLGCVADLGIYPVLTAWDIFRAEPVRYEATAWPVHDQDKTDVYAQATLWFDDRRYLHFEASAAYDQQRPGSAEVSSYTIVGDKGIIQVGGSWAMNGYGWIDMCGPGGWQSVPVEPVDPYLSQYRLLAACADGAPVPDEVSIGRGVADLKILYAIADAAAAASAAASDRTRLEADHRGAREAIRMG